MDKLIGCLYRRIIKENLDVLSDDLRMGRLGVFLFLTVYSKIKENNSAVRRSQILLQNIWNDLFNKIDSSSNECGEFVYVLRYLEDIDMFQKDEKAENWFASVDNRLHFDYFFSRPLSWNGEKEIFEQGIYVLQLRRDEDTLERYTIDEALISLIEHCERLFFSTIEYNIYRPENMTASLLHSILYFLNEMEKLRIYPFKTEKLLKYIPQIYNEIQHSSPLDDFVFHVLLNDGKENVSELIKSEKDLITSLGSIGLYCFLYRNPQLFNSAWMQIQILYPYIHKILEKEIKSATLLGMNGLSGLGYGLLSIWNDKILDNEKQTAKNEVK